jgi:predicted RNA binding protein YcfA (HicA-like mRNA interferase family)
MSRNPRVTGVDLIGAFGKAGFGVLRVIGPGLLHKILRDCQITAAELLKLL